MHAHSAAREQVFIVDDSEITQMLSAESVRSTGLCKSTCSALRFISPDTPLRPQPVIEFRLSSIEDDDSGSG